MDHASLQENNPSDEVFLEAQVKNRTAGPINLEKVSLESSQMFKVSSLNNIEENKPGGRILQPKASRQYLYCLSPTYNAEGENILEATDIGRLDIAWQSALGERGRLQTSPLLRGAPSFGDLRVSVHNLPNIVKIEEPFTFTCKIANLSKTSLDLILGLENLYPDLLWIGPSGRHLGRIEMGDFIMVELTLLPLSAGLHSISGIRLKDTFTSNSSNYNDVAQVFVT